MRLLKGQQPAWTLGPSPSASFSKNCPSRPPPAGCVAPSKRPDLSEMPVPRGLNIFSIYVSAQVGKLRKDGGRWLLPSLPFLLGRTSTPTPIPGFIQIHLLGKGQCLPAGPLWAPSRLPCQGPSGASVPSVEPTHVRLCPGTWSDRLSGDVNAGASRVSGYATLWEEELIESSGNTKGSLLGSS